MTHNHGIKELLTLAAKACGYTLEDHYDVNEIYYPWCHEIRGGLGDYWHRMQTTATASGWRQS